MCSTLHCAVGAVCHPKSHVCGLALLVLCGPRARCRFTGELTEFDPQLAGNRLASLVPVNCQVVNAVLRGSFENKRPSVLQ